MHWLNISQFQEQLMSPDANEKKKDETNLSAQSSNRTAHVSKTTLEALKKIRSIECDPTPPLPLTAFNEIERRSKGPTVPQIIYPSELPSSNPLSLRLDLKMKASLTQQPFGSSRIDKKALQKKWIAHLPQPSPDLVEEIHSLATEIKGTPSESERKRVGAVFHAVHKKCEQDSECKPLQEFVESFEKHDSIRKRFGSEIYARKGASFIEETWLSGTDPKRTRFTHTTQLSNLQGILEKGVLETRYGRNSQQLGVDTHERVYVAHNNMWESFGQFTLVFKSSALLDKTTEEVSRVSYYSIGLKTPIEVSSRTLECIAVDFELISPKKLAIFKRNIQRWAGWDIPIQDANALRAEFDCIRRHYEGDLPKHWEQLHTNDSHFINPSNP